MIYIILTYLFSPFIYLCTALKKRENISRILVIQTAKIGDLICSTPIFREIRKNYPSAYLAVMASPVASEILNGNPRIDEVITWDTKASKGFGGKLRLSNLIRKGDYDVAVCMNPNVPFAIGVFWGLVPLRLSLMPDFAGITFRLASLFFTYREPHVSGRMVIETFLRMLRQIGVERVSTDKEIYKSATADTKIQSILNEIEGPLIGIAVSSGNKLKEIGIGMLGRLAAMLLDAMEGISIVLIGSQQDKAVANAVLQFVGRKERIIDTTGRLDLSELPALLERLSIFIGVDTGIAYMADALSIPIIFVAGPVDISEQRPTGDKVKIVQLRVPCSPCTHVFKTSQVCEKKTRVCIESDEILDRIVSAAKELAHAKGEPHGRPR